MIKNARFISLWDGGFEIETSCKVNMDTKEVFDIETVEVDNYDLEVLDKEQVVIDEETYFVCQEDEYNREGFYYR